MMIGRKIQVALRMSNHTQRELSARLHVPASTICGWIKGDVASVPSEYVLPICDFCGCSVTSLLSDSDTVEVKSEPAKDRFWDLYDSLDDDGKVVVQSVIISESRRRA